MAEIPEYSLHLSHDAGLHYRLDLKSADFAMLKRRGRGLDEMGLRWYIEGPNGRQVECSAIHKAILASVLDHGQLDQARHVRDLYRQTLEGSG